MSRTEIAERTIETIVKRTVQTMAEDASTSLARASKLIADTHDFVEKLSHDKHSVTQELIDQGAYDVAKNYIDFLKSAQGIPMPPPPDLRTAKNTTPRPQKSSATGVTTVPKKVVKEEDLWISPEWKKADMSETVKKDDEKHV